MTLAGQRLSLLVPALVLVIVIGFIPPMPPTLEAPAGHDQSPEQIRGMFTAITPAYDRLNHLLSGQLDRRWRKLAARSAVKGLRPRSRVLDVATGTGDLAHALAKQTEKDKASAHEHGVEGTIVWGLDFTRAMVRRAPQKYGHHRFRWLEGDGLRLPLADGRFDACTIAFGLRNMADKAAALREMTRILRPGGRLVILEFSQPPNRLIRWGYDLYSYKIMPRLGVWLSGSKAYLYLADSIRGFYGADALADAMRQSGLRDVVYRRLMFGVVCLHVGIKS